MRYLLALGTAFYALSSAASAHSEPNSSTIAQPTSCISTQFSATGWSQYWKDIKLILINNCGKTVDFQNSTVKFQNSIPLDTAFWGDFSPLSYPDNELKITSQPDGSGKYLATLTMKYPTYPGANSKLPAGKSITLKYGAESEGHIEGTANVYLSEAIATGDIKLTNAAKPANVTQTYSLIHLTMNGQAVKDINLPWSTSQTLTGLAAGNYAVSAENISDSSGSVYRGTANPSTLAVTANQTVSTNISYALVQQTGKISLKLSPLPAQLTGYSDNPTVLLTQQDTGSSVAQALTWGNTNTVSQLKSGSQYNLSTAVINYNDYKCSPTFLPASMVASESPTNSSTLSYQCVQQAQTSVSLDVKGAPPTATSVILTLTPSDGTAAVTQTIALNNGSGTSTILLPEGKIYTVSAPAVDGYTISFSPQPLTVTANATVTVTFAVQAATKGRIIGYVPGWKAPPPATALASAGYTHVMIAFGVFSTSVPGEIVPAFDTVTKEYIQSLHAAGIKVILSLGGALSNLPNTSVDFHQVLAMATSPTAFKSTFKESLKSLISQYGFDGFDIDIEHGINGGGTFANPQGDIAVLADIINTLHSENPNLLITMAPQVANISANRNFDQTWGNYASLVMQTHDSLTWVGVQLYNTGCAYGIDMVCYDVNVTNSPNFSVAMAVDLLANWPATLANGQATGFQPYVSYLSPSQIVLGYPSANADGVGDGSPVTPTSTIKRAIQCLKTAVASNTSCGSYIPPKAYGAIGGVFNWEVTYDQSNNFRFATDLKNCVINGVCN